MINGTSHQKNLEQLGFELVHGSLLQAEMEFRKKYHDYADHYHHMPSATVVDNIMEEVGFNPAVRWGIGPSGASSAEFMRREGEPEILTLSEFIGGIAVECGIDPTRADIDTTIFYIGKFMAELEPANA